MVRPARSPTGKSLPDEPCVASKAEAKGASMSVKPSG
jgi:hypothetical protein